MTDAGDASFGDPGIASNAVVEIETATNAVASPNVQMGEDPEGIAF